MRGSSVGVPCLLLGEQSMLLPGYDGVKVEVRRSYDVSCMLVSAVPDTLIKLSTIWIAFIYSEEPSANMMML